MSNISVKDIYQEIVIDHYKNPHNKRVIEGAPSTKLENFLCGDWYEIFIFEHENILTDVSFTGTGCVISTASASLLTDLLKGKTTQLAQYTIDNVLLMIVGKLFNESQIGRMITLSNISNFPARTKCAALPWLAAQNVVQRIEHDRRTAREASQDGDCNAKGSS